MAIVTKNFTLNVTPGAMPPTVHVSEYDIGRTYAVQLLDENGSAYEIPTGTTATVEGTLNGTVGFTTSATISNNQISFALTESMTAYAGKAWCKIKLTLNDKPIQTCAFILAVDRAGVEADTVIGADGFETQIQNAVNDYLQDFAIDDEVVRDAVDDYLDENGIDTESITTATTDWLNDNVTPVGSAVVVDSSLSVSGAAADAKVTGDEIGELKSAFDTVKNVNAGRNLNRYIKSGKWSSSGSTTVDFITYSPDKIVVNGTASANVACFISDTISLPSGDYVVNTDSVSDTTNIHLQVVSQNASVRYGDSEYDGEQEFSFDAATDVKVTVWVAAGTYNNVTLFPCFGTAKPYSNEMLTAIADTLADTLNANENVLAGENVTPLDSGTYSANNVTIQYSSDGSVVINSNGAVSANSSVFVTPSKILPAGSYTIFDGTKAHNGDYYACAYTSEIVARSDGVAPGMGFTLNSATSTRIIVWVKAGASFTNLKLYPKIVNSNNYSTSELSGFVSGLAGYSAKVVSEAVKTGFFPWAVPAPINAAQEKFYDAVKNIRLYGADIDTVYFVKQVMVNHSGLVPSGTYITVYTGDTKVCEYFSSFNLPHEKMTLHFEECGNSGISGEFEIDFTNLQDGYTPGGNGTPAIYGISKQALITSKPVSILIPDTIYAVVGKETNIYWSSAIECADIADVIIEVVGNGENLGNRWSYVPSAAGTFQITVRVRNHDYRTLAEKTVTVVASANNLASAKTLTAIHLGDSMIDNNYHLAHLESDISGSGLTYNIIGTRPHSEGRGGWTSGQYLQLAESVGVPNAFYNPTTNTFDFSYYMQQQGYSGVDVVFIFLGTNDVKGSTQFQGAYEAVRNTVSNINTIINSIHSYSSSIKVCVEIPAIGAAQQYPYAKMYGDNRIKQALHKFGIQWMAKAFFENYSGRESENIYVLPVGNSLDDANGFPTAEVNASARIASQIKVQTDCYHPTSEGYHQFADCEWAFIRNKLT